MSAARSDCAGSPPTPKAQVCRHKLVHELLRKPGMRVESAPVMRACQSVIFCSSMRTKTEEEGLRGRSMLRPATSLPTRTMRGRGCASSAPAAFAYLWFFCVARPATKPSCTVHATTNSDTAFIEHEHKVIASRSDRFLKTKDAEQLRICQLSPTKALFSGRGKCGPVAIFRNRGCNRCLMHVKVLSTLSTGAWIIC